MFWPFLAAFWPFRCYNKALEETVLNSVMQLNHIKQCWWNWSYPSLKIVENYFVAVFLSGFQFFVFFFDVSSLRHCQESRVLADQSKGITIFSLFEKEETFSVMMWSPHAVINAFINDVVTKLLNLNYLKVHKWLIILELSNNIIPCQIRIMKGNWCFYLILVYHAWLISFLWFLIETY